jgi:hypothetical protein
MNYVESGNTPTRLAGGLLLPKDFVLQSIPSVIVNRARSRSVLLECHITNYKDDCETLAAKHHRRCG